MAYFDTAGLKYSGFRATSTISTSTIWALPNADGTSGQVLTTDGNGNLKWTSVAGASIGSLNGQTGATQTFVNDTNIQISSAANAHTLTWAGVLSVARGGTGTSTTPTFGKVLVGNNAGGYDLVATSTLFATGYASTSIGAAVQGATATGIFFIDPTTGKLAQDTANFNYNPITQKLKVTGGIDPVYFSAQATSTNNNAFYEAFAGENAALAPANVGRLRYNATSQRWEVSMNGSSYQAIATSSTSGSFGTLVATSSALLSSTTITGQLITGSINSTSTASSTFAGAVTASNFLATTFVSANGVVGTLISTTSATLASTTLNGQTIAGNIIATGTATATNVVATNLTSTNIAGTNATVTSATTTNFFTTNFATANGIFGTLAATSSATLASTTLYGQAILGNLIATGTATNTFGGAITVGAGQGTSTFAAGISANTLKLNSFADLAALTFTNATGTSIVVSIASSTAVIATNLTATNGTTTNLVSTNATTTNFYTTNFTTSNGAFGTLVATSSAALASTTLIDRAIVGYIVSTSSATSTFGGAITVAAGAGTSTFAGGLSAANISTAGFLSVSGLASLVDLTFTNATGTALVLTTGAITNLTAANATATNAVFTNASTTNFYTQSFAAASALFGTLVATTSAQFASTTLFGQTIAGKICDGHYSKKYWSSKS
jgi:hypothetical protein